MRALVTIFLITRLALVATVVGALAVFPSVQCAVCADASRIPLLTGLARWDGLAYLRIAREWYGGPDIGSVIAYFPLYPALMRLLGTVLGGSDDAYLFSGIAISNAATLAAVLALRGLGTKVDERTTSRGAILLLVFPTTIFLSAVYADALFLALAIASANEAARGRVWRAGFLATAAALTRPFGVIAILPLVIRFVRGGLRPRIALVPIFAPALAFALWNAYLYTITGDPLASMHGYASGFTPRSPLQSITDLFDPAVYGFPWFIGGAFALFVVLAVVSWRATTIGQAAYGTAMLLVTVAAGSLASSMRYELSMYPAFIALASLVATPVARALWIVASSALAIVFAAMFALSFWIG